MLQNTSKFSILVWNYVSLNQKNLETLDGKAINDVTRTFLKSFDRVKTEQKQKLPVVTNEVGIVINTVDIDLREESPSMNSNAITFDVSQIISQAIIENVQCKPCVQLNSFSDLEQTGLSLQPDGFTSNLNSRSKLVIRSTSD